MILYLHLPSAWVVLAPRYLSSRCSALTPFIICRVHYDVNLFLDTGGSDYKVTVATSAGGPNSDWAYLRSFEEKRVIQRDTFAAKLGKTVSQRVNGSLSHDYLYMDKLWGGK